VCLLVYKKLEQPSSKPLLFFFLPKKVGSLIRANHFFSSVPLEKKDIMPLLAMISRLVNFLYLIRRNNTFTSNLVMSFAV